jgi:hypothetical protein
LWRNLEVRESVWSLILIVFLASCVTGPRVAGDEEGLLRKRVEAYWTARAKGDWTMVETFVVPDARPEFQAHFKSLKESPFYAEFKSIEIKELVIREEHADVTVEYSVKSTHPLLAGAPVMERRSKEMWRKTGDEWYVVMEKPDPAKFFQRFGPKEGGR